MNTIADAEGGIDILEKTNFQDVFKSFTDKIIQESSNTWNEILVIDVQNIYELWEYLNTYFPVSFEIYGIDNLLFYGDRVIKLIIFVDLNKHIVMVKLWEKVKFDLESQVNTFIETIEDVNTEDNNILNLIYKNRKEQYKKLSKK